MPTLPDKAPSPAIALEVHDLTVSYNKRPVLWGVDFTLPAGALACIVGPNGAGKSTLIKAIMGLLPLSSGYADLLGKSLQTVRRQISYVPQRESVDWDFPISVREVVSMGRLARRSLFARPTEADRLAIDQALADVDLAAYANRQISQLSGGQQQRVFIARALAQQPDFFFLDEPFAGVDVASEAAIVALLKRLSAAGKTVVVVHHDLQTVPAYFSHAVLLNSRLIAAGPVEQVFTNDNLAATYGGKLTILTKVAQEAAGRGIDIRKP